MPKQIPFEYDPLPPNSVLRGKANQSVFDALDRQNWPNGRVAIIGSQAAGKTAIAQALCQAGGIPLGTADGTQSLHIGDAPMVLIDNFARFLEQDGAETAFFHLLNETQAQGVKVVVFTRAPLDKIEVSLPDLRSRLATFESFEIEEPDDELMRGLIAKRFVERGVFVAPDVVEYLAKRLERSYLAIEKAVEALDQMALSEKGKVNKPRVKLYLESKDQERLL